MVGDHSNRNGAESGPHFVLPKRTVKQSLWRTLKRGSKCRKKRGENGKKDKREKNIERAWKQGKQKRKKRVCQTKNSVRAKGRRNNKNFRHIKYDILARRQPGRKISYIEAWLAGWPEIYYTICYMGTHATLFSRKFMYMESCLEKVTLTN